MTEMSYIFTVQTSLAKVK